MLKDERSGPDIDTARRVAQEVTADLAKVFPPGWVSAHFSPPMHEFKCRKCGSPIARRIDALKTGDTIECSGCSHQWEAVINNDGHLELNYIVYDWQCRCGSTQEIQHHGMAGRSLALPVTQLAPS
jgi:DNA-directed RNA polymerase subunit RPC12/RpoP